MSLARSLTNYQPYDVLLQSPLFVVRVADVMFVICLTACICSAQTHIMPWQLLVWGIFHHPVVIVLAS